MACFKIKDTFEITNRGIVLTGFIINGRIEIGDFISINVSNKRVLVRINSIEEIDNGVDKISKTGLLIGKEDFLQIEPCNLQNKEVEILKPVTGLDISLAASYGIGVKWWAGIVTFVIMTLIFLLWWLITNN